MADENTQAIVEALNGILQEMKKLNLKLDAIQSSVAGMERSAEFDAALNLAEADFDGGQSCSSLSDAVACIQKYVDERKSAKRFDNYIFGRRSRISTRDPLEVNNRR